MKQKTINKYFNLITEIENSGLSIFKYCQEHNLCYNSTLKGLNTYVEEYPDTELANKIEDLKRHVNGITKEEEDSVNNNRTFIDRDENGKIVGYSYEIHRKNKPVLEGTLSRDDMTIIYRLYSYYGASLTQREISRHFPQLSLVDFKRILTAFGIYKASSPFPPHYFEEYSEDELKEIQLREKENDFLKHVEEDRIKNNERLLKKLFKENQELKNKNNYNFTINTSDLTPVQVNTTEQSGKIVSLYISDMHIGAKLNSGMMYTENCNYGFNEVQRRLQTILSNLSSIGPFDSVILNLMGDNVDCCGQDGMTARLDHIMPENMDAREQGNVYISIILWFVNCLFANKITSKIEVYSVPCGNHGGNMEFFCNQAIMYALNAIYDKSMVTTCLFNTFYGAYQISNHVFVICHGKDSQFHKKGLPLNLDDKTRSMIYEWLDSESIHSENIHIIKGDLHADNLNSNARFDYRNVLSLFGASDYSNYNYSRNSYGVSYDMFIGDILVRGTFTNI